ncbi:MAG: hypothetical protein U5K33_08640 [Halofilum sp. (in: g-proteobacteria)]|nr:hypothetical protein [Halofilum sp. (in: g-proteobacteria)]
MEYHDELARIAETGAAMDHDDPAAADAQARFRSLFDHFTPDALPGAVRETYSARAFFNDSLKTVREREALAVYLAESAMAVDKCTVTIDEWTPARTGWYVRWRMTIRFRRFKRGIDTESIGVSHIVFDRDGRVALHQDFWDAAGGLYEHVPLLGGLIRKIRQRL